MANNTSINDLDENQIIALENSLTNVKSKVDKERYKDSVRYLEWINDKVELQIKSNKYTTNKQKDEKNYHPIRPRRGDVYLTELGENIGSEINKQHLVLIMQNNKGNMYSDTVVAIPISGSGKLHKTHQKIERKDIKSGRLDKIPSKAKTEQIHYLDKARLIHKVATLEEECIKKICKRLKDNLCL